MRTYQFVSSDWDIGDDQSMWMMEDDGYLFREGLEIADVDRLEEFLNQWPSIASIKVGEMYYPVSVHATLMPVAYHPSLMTLAHFSCTVASTSIGPDVCYFGNAKMVNSRVPEFLKHVVVLNNEADYEEFKFNLVLTFSGTSGGDWKINERHI